MNCTRANRRIEAYLDGDLGARARKEMARHLELCPGCRQRAARAQRMLAALGETTPALPPKDFTRNVMTRLPETIPAPYPSRQGFSFPAPVGRRWRPLAAGAVLLALVAGGYLWFQWRGDHSSAFRRELEGASQYLSKRDFAGAIAAYRKAIDLEPRSAEARLGLAYALWEIGSSHEAAEQYKEVIASPSTSSGSLALAYESLGKIHHDEGEVEQAVECYESAVRLDPNMIDSRANLAVIYEQWGLETQATTEYEAVANLDPTFSFAYEALGRLRENNGELEKGAQAYQRGIEATGSPVACWRLGRLFEKIGLWEEAIDAYQRAVFGDPGAET